MGYREISTVSLVCGAHSNMISSEVRILFRSGRCAVIGNEDLKNLHDDTHNHFLISPQIRNDFYRKRIQQVDSTWSEVQKVNASVAASKVDGERWFADVKKLACSIAISPVPGNLEARDFFVKSFKNLVGLSVSTQEFAVRGRQAWNVIATYNCETPDARQCSLRTL